MDISLTAATSAFVRAVTAEVINPDQADTCSQDLSILLTDLYRCSFLPSVAVDSGHDPSAHTEGVWRPRHLAALGGALWRRHVPMELSVAPHFSAGLCVCRCLPGLDVR